MAINFKCDGCGLCCRHIDRIPPLKNFDTGNGVCKFLDTATNRCSIYLNRSALCNVAVGYQKYFANVYTEEEYLRLNYEACDQLKREHSKEVSDDTKT